MRATIDYLRNNVFDKKNMPWFRDSYAAPEPDWGRKFASLVKIAAEPDDGEGAPRETTPVQNRRVRLPD